MEDIIKRLSDIENSAADIVTHAADEKKKKKDKMVSQQNDLTSLIEKDTAEKLEQLTKHLEESKACSLQQLKEKTDAVLIYLEKEYEENHSAYAKDIFKKIIEV